MSLYITRVAKVPLRVPFHDRYVITVISFLAKNTGTSNAPTEYSLSHTSSLTHPLFQGEEAQSVALQWGAGQELCFVVCDLAVSGELEVSLITRKSAKWPTHSPMWAQSRQNVRVVLCVPGTHE